MNLRPHAPARPAPARPAAAAAVLLAALLAWPLPGPASPRGDDHDRARQAVLARDVLPWPEVARRLERSHPGQLLDLELEHDDGRWVYEVRLLQAGGRVLRLKVDARTAEVLRERVRQRRDGEGRH